MWADEFFHIGNIAASGVSGEHFSSSVCRGDADARHHCSVASRQHLVFLRRGADPLHGEVLEGHEQLAEIAARDLDFVIGKDEAQDFSLVGASEGGGDEMLKRKDVNLAACRFKAKAGGWSFALPARWRGRCRWLVGFGAVFHGDGVFVV